MDNRKIMTAAVVAMFCLAAFAFILGGDSYDAADKKTYELYLEIIEDDGTVSNTAYVYFDSEADNEKYAAAANAAFVAAGLSDITVTISQSGGIWFNYKDGSNATFYSDGTKWVDVAKTEKDFIENTKACAALGNGYISEDVYDELSDLDKTMWKETGWGGAYAYIKIPEDAGTFDKILNYTVNMTLIDDDLVRTTADTITFQSENTPDAWCYAINNAVKGNSVFSKLEATAGLFLTITFDGSYSNATYYKADGKWVDSMDPATDYVSGAELDFELKNGYISEEKYNALSKGQKECWKKTDMGGDYTYQRLAQATPGSDSSGNDNTMLYIGIAIVVIVIIAAGVFFFVKKKNA